MHFDAYLAGLPGLELLEYEAGERNNYQYVVIGVDEARLGRGRDRLLKALLAENVIRRLIRRVIEQREAAAVG